MAFRKQKRSKYKPVIPVFVMAIGGRKGQGLPINLIVILIIGVLILLLVIAFATGSITKLFGGTKNIGEAVTPDQVATFRIGCSQGCFSAQQLANTEGDWKKSDYCARKLLNGTSTDIKCWHIGADCSKKSTIDGTNYLFNSTGDGGIIFTNETNMTTNVIGCIT